MTSFAEKLNILLRENKITKYKLAKDLKCSKQSVCNWCDGISSPNIDKLKQIAVYFDVSSDYLLGLEDDNGVKTYNNYYNNYGTQNGDVNF